MKKDLSKKILCTILAASAFGVCGNVWAQQADTFENGTFTLAEGKHYTDNGNNVWIDNSVVTVDGTYDVNNVGVVGGSKITVNGSGVIGEGLDVGVDDASNTKPFIEAHNAEIHGIVDVASGTVTLHGGEILASDYLEIENGNYVQEFIHVDANGQLTANNVKITGIVMAENAGAEIVINGGSITESEWYAQANDNNNELDMVGGKPVVDGYTDIQAEMGGKVTINNAEVNSSLDAQGVGSLITINNSNVNTRDGIIAWNGGKIVLAGNADTVYKVDTDGTGYGYFMAAKLNGEDSGQIVIKGGTLKADNLRYLVGIEGNNHGYLNEKYDSEHIKNFEIVKGGIVLQENGIIETKADQIFENGVDVTNDNTVINSVSGKVTNDAISYDGGTLKLNDEKYSLCYLNSAMSNLTAYQADSETKIVMTGTLVNASGVQDRIDVSDLDKTDFGSTAEMDKVTVVTDKNLVIGGSAGENENSVANGFSAGNLEMGKNAEYVKIVNNRELVLGGSQGGSIITGAENEVSVIVGTGNENESGSFKIGNSMAASDTVYNLKGSVTVNTGSSLATKGQTTISGGVTLNNGSLDVVNGLLKADITASGRNTITGAVNSDTLNSENNSVINVGSREKAGNLVVKEAALNGAAVFLDPAWKDGAEISDASNMVVENSTELDGKYVAGQNAVLSFGAADAAAAQDAFADTGLTWGEKDITAALYVAKGVDLTNGAIAVDGDKVSLGDLSALNAGSFTAAANSLTMVNGQNIKETAALNGVIEAVIAQNSEGQADGAKLYIENARKGEIYKVISGSGINPDSNVWSDENIISNNSLLVFTGDKNVPEQFNVTAGYDKVDNVYGEGSVIIAGIVDNTLEKETEGAAFDFFNAAADSKNNATKEAQITAFNSAANMGELGGVSHAAYSISNAMTDAVADHLSLASHGDKDKDIWAHYVHNKENVEGISLGGINADYDLQYNGIVVGSDLYNQGKATAGIAISYIDGDVNSSNIASGTKNEVEYYGAAVYGRIDNGNSAVLGDITYMHGSNDISQSNSGHELTADTDTDVFSIGVKAEQKIKAGIGQFVPYAGLRYMHIGTGNYSNSIGLNYDVEEQNLWLLPVGVTYVCDIKAGNWTIRPVAEAGYVWAMGDRNTSQTVSLSGAADGFGFDTADSGSFVGRFAVEAEKANVSYSLGYEYQKGDTVKANKWMANMIWRF